MNKKVNTGGIKESVEELGVLERSAVEGLVRERVRFIRLLKEDTSSNVTQAAEKTGSYKKSWAYNIWRLYKEKAVEGISTYPFQGSTPRLSKEAEQKLKEALQNDSVSTLHRAASLIKEVTGVSYCDSAVWFVFKRLGIKKKTGRPKNVRKDEAEAEAFKKKPCSD